MYDFFNAASKLSDIHYAIHYWLATKRIKQREVSSIVNKISDKIVADAQSKEAIDDIDIHFAQFFELQSKTKDSSLPRPTLVVMDEVVALSATLEKFLDYVKPQYRAHVAWQYSKIPNYFVENPIDGIDSLAVSDFSGTPHITKPSLVFSVAEFLKGCTTAGYIRHSMELRLFAQRGDQKAKNKVIKLFDYLGILITKFERINLKNNLIEYSFHITVRNSDTDNLIASKNTNSKYAELISKVSTGNSYFVYFDDELAIEKGFKTQADIQKFIIDIKDNIICLDGAKNPTHIYLKQTIHLLNFRNKKGDTISLSKFRF